MVIGVIKEQLEPLDQMVRLDSKVIKVQLVAEVI
jgi:hypothetical protein